MERNLILEGELSWRNGTPMIADQALVAAVAEWIGANPEELQLDGSAGRVRLILEKLPDVDEVM